MLRKWVFLLCTLAMLWCFVPGVVWAEGTAVSRQVFVRQLKQITEGMPAKRVKALLGKPDYIGHYPFDTPTVWFYGCEGPRKVPTLGAVEFSEKGRVRFVWGYSGSPPPPTVIKEKELRQVLSLLDQVPFLGEDDDPGGLIRIVNRLIPLGKTKILSAIAEYERVVNWTTRPDSSRTWKEPASLLTNPSEALTARASHRMGGTEHLIILLRVLFDIPGSLEKAVGETEPLPEIRIGHLLTPPPFDKTLAPRFPIVLIDDIPLAEYSGSSLGGRPEDVMNHMPFYEKHGRLRTRPLRPTDHPEEVLAHLEASPQWLLGNRYQVQKEYGRFDQKLHDYVVPTYYEVSEGDREDMRSIMKRQILKLLSPVYPDVVKISMRKVVNLDVESMQLSVEVDERQWDAIMADLKQHPVRWNPITNQYERVAKGASSP